jgi:TrmH family RNA methyltransferase
MLEGTSRGAALKQALESDGVAIEPVTDDELVELAATEQPQGIVGVVDVRPWNLEEIPLAPRSTVLALDAVQDPGNAGGMLRTALALGAAGVVALDGTVELANPKAVRASMGAWFRVPGPTASVEQLLAWARDGGAAIWVAAAGGMPLRPPADDRPLVIVVGNEGAGVRPELASAAERVIAIPIAEGAESLNVGVAAGILLYALGRHHLS